MTTVTISLPESLKVFVTEQMRRRGFGNVSEYFRTLLRKAQEQESEARLEALLVAGLDSGPEAELTREFWKGLRSEAAQTLRRRRKVRR